jgi:hypothetical protein
MRKIRTKLSWKPIRRGAIYCAPACGGGCTKAAHDQAKQTGRIIAMMLGVGWKVSMNENLGWHWTVVSPCGRIRVSGGYKENFPKRFHAMLCQPGDCAGRYTGEGRTPRAAVKNVIRRAKNHLAEIGAFIEGL